MSLSWQVYKKRTKNCYQLWYDIQKTELTTRSVKQTSALIQTALYITIMVHNTIFQMAIVFWHRIKTYILTGASIARWISRIIKFKISISKVKRLSPSSMMPHNFIWKTSNFSVNVVHRGKDSHRIHLKHKSNKFLKLPSTEASVAKYYPSSSLRI